MFKFHAHDGLRSEFFIENFSCGNYEELAVKNVCFATLKLFRKHKTFQIAHIFGIFEGILVVEFIEISYMIYGLYYRMEKF